MYAKFNSVPQPQKGNFVNTDERFRRFVDRHRIALEAWTAGIISLAMIAVTCIAVIHQAPAALVVAFGVIAGLAFAWSLDSVHQESAPLWGLIDPPSSER